MILDRIYKQYLELNSKIDETKIKIYKLNKYYDNNNIDSKSYNKTYDLLKYKLEHLNNINKTNVHLLRNGLKKDYNK